MFHGQNKECVSRENGENSLKKINKCITLAIHFLADEVEWLSGQR
jgi:hypothetical protein